MKKFATLVTKSPIGFDGKEWQYKTTESRVRVMVEAEGYAMVRHFGCMPFVVPIADLRDVKATVK